MATTNGVNGVHPDVKPDYDTLVIGAGFAGLRMIHELRKQNVTFRVLEAGTGKLDSWLEGRTSLLPFSQRVIHLLMLIFKRPGVGGTWFVTSLTSSQRY